jgi:rubredoxin
MNQKPNVKINLSGGLVSPSYLLSVLKIAQGAGVEAVHFGARQQLLLYVHPREMALFSKKMKLGNFEFENDMEGNPNITSSYAFADLFTTATTEGWLSEGMYLDIFNEFDFKPQLKINVCDAAQSHAPFFTGHLNFISSDVPHFWFCFIRIPKTNQIERYPNLIYTHDLAVFSKKIESLILKNTVKNVDSITNALDTEGVIMREAMHDLEIPRFVMPYYEGVNTLSSGKLWLGIYRRNEDFSLNFLIEMCQLCEESRIGNIGISNWRSLVIKGIEKTDRFKWEKLLGKYGINVRHAANELNWQTEDDSPKGMRLKKYLVKQFDKLDLRTFGLVFAVKTRHKSEVFGSVIIRREPLFKFGQFEFDPFGWFGSYDIFYAQDFNPHTRKRKTFAKEIPKSRLAEEILNLSRKYYAELAGEKKTRKIRLKENSQVLSKNSEKTYRCSMCWTVYHPAMAFDAENKGIETAFEHLPETFECPICGTEKQGFEYFNILPMADI